MSAVAAIVLALLLCALGLPGPSESLATPAKSVVSGSHASGKKRPAPHPSSLPRLKAVPDPVNGGRIVDSKGRQVILRGVNVNSLGEYWQGKAISPVLPLDRRDPGRISRIGWNSVRLILSWSKVEPKPGEFNEKYLKTVSTWVKRFRDNGIYTIIDLHQDAWGATLAARPGESCPPAYQPAFGWDGAPGWATFDGGLPHCFIGARETSPAVQNAWKSFFDDVPASDGVGIQTHYVNMLRKLARTFAKEKSVAGIDIMNEPGAFGPIPASDLSAFYARSVKSIRKGEKSGHGFRHLVFFEPSVLWSLVGNGAPPPFTDDDQIVYSPHLYGGSIGTEGPPSQASFETALAEAKTFGGAPLVTGEWGGNPARATHADDDYFLAHQALQDQYGIGATLWTWKQSCGDPHAATNDPESAPSLPPWPVFTMDCSNGGNRIVGMNRDLVRDLRRGYVRKAPGKLVRSSWNPLSLTLTAEGKGARKNQGRLEAFMPTQGVTISRRGLTGYRLRKLGSGSVISFQPTDGKWRLKVHQVFIR